MSCKLLEVLREPETTGTDDPDIEAAQFIPSPKSGRKPFMELLKVLSCSLSILLLVSLLALFRTGTVESFKGAAIAQKFASERGESRESRNEENPAIWRWRLPPDPLRKANRNDLDAAFVRFLKMAGHDQQSIDDFFKKDLEGDGGENAENLDEPTDTDEIGPSEPGGSKEAPIPRRLQGFGRKIRGGAWWSRYKAAKRAEDYEVDPFGGISCYQTVFSCVWYLGYIGQQIDVFTLNQTCPDTSGAKTCSGGVMNLVQNLAWFLIAATQIPQYCVSTYTSPNSVNCFTSMTTFVGSGVEITGDALNTVNDCAYLHPSPTLPDGRRLFGEAEGSEEHGELGEDALAKLGPAAPNRSALPAPPWAMNWWLNNEANAPNGMGTNGNSGVPGNRVSTKVLCAFQSMETVDDVLTVGMNIWAIVQSCVPLPTDAQGEESCTSDVLSFIGSLPNVAQDIFNIMQACPLFYKLWAPCAADAADIAQCSLGIGAWAASVEQSCVA